MQSKGRERPDSSPATCSYARRMIRDVTFFLDFLLELRVGWKFIYI